jgi:hypothetical protein
VTDANAWERARATIAGAASDFDVTIQGSTEGDYGLGLVYGASATADDGYAVLVHPAQFQGVYLKQLVPGQPDIELANAPLAPGLAGTPLTLRVVRQGTQVTVWLNGAQVLQGSDGAAGLAGRLGLLLSDTDETTDDASVPPGAVFTLLRVDSESSAGGATSDAGEDAAPPTAAGGLPYAIGLAIGGDTWARVEGELGRPMDVLQTYSWSDTWSDWAQLAGPINDSDGNNDPLHHPATYSLALLLTSGTDLATAASGAYDSYYEQFAQNLAASGNIPGTNLPAIAAVRIGWEMNGSWFPWSIANSSNQVDPTLAANYVAAFRRLAGFIRTYAPHILIDWCINQSGADPTSAYPGDDVVDIVGMDLYEQNVGSFAGAVGNGSDFLLAWLDKFSNATYGTNAPAGQTGGKKLISFPEWQATANDGAFVTQMAAWMNARGGRISYWNYWDSDDAVNPGGSLWENASINAAFVAAWSGTTFGGTDPLTIPAGF